MQLDLILASFLITLFIVVLALIKLLEPIIRILVWLCSPRLIMWMAGYNDYLNWIIFDACARYGYYSEAQTVLEDHDCGDRDVTMHRYYKNLIYASQEQYQWYCQVSLVGNPNKVDALLYYMTNGRHDITDYYLKTYTLTADEINDIQSYVNCNQI